jgi:hypothetical protein
MEPEGFYHVHKSPPLDPILSQVNPVHPINPNLPMVHLNVIINIKMDLREIKGKGKGKSKGKVVPVLFN